MKTSEASTLENCVTEYLNNYAGGRRHTGRAKRVDLEYFISFIKQFLGEAGEILLLDVNPAALQQFVNHRINKGDAPATVIRRMATVRHFFKTCVELYPGFINPATDIKLPAKPAVRPQTLHEDQVQSILDSLENKRVSSPSFKSIRDEVLVHTMLSTGLRADEIRVLRLGQMSDDGLWFNAVKTKGGKFRKVRIADDLRERIEAYLPMREEEIRKKLYKLPLVTNRNIPLFVGVRGAHAADVRSFRLNEKTIWRIVSAAGEGAGVHPHLLRHTFANRLLETTKDLRLVAQTLGHSDVRVTMKYSEPGDEEVTDSSNPDSICS